MDAVLKRLVQQLLLGLMAMSPVAASAAVNTANLLSPNIVAPVKLLNVQTQSMQHVVTRLVTLRNKIYSAGVDEINDSRWLRPFGDYTRQQTLANMPGYNARTTGMSFGIDQSVSDYFTMGIAGTYSFSRIKEQLNVNSYADVKSYQAMLYSSYNFWRSVYLDLIAAFAVNKYKGHRFATINSVNSIAISKYNNTIGSIKGVFGNNCKISRNALWSPEFSLQYSRSTKYNYQETSGGAANVIMNKPSYNFLQVGLGSKLAVINKTRNAITMPEIHATVLYNPIYKTPNAKAHLVSGGSQTLNALTLNKAAVRTGVALTCIARSSLELKLNFDLEFQARYQSYFAYFNIKYLLY